MRKIFTLILASSFTFAVWAQKQYGMKVVLKNGQTVEYATTDIESVNFVTYEQLPTEPEVTGASYSVAVPSVADFSASQVYKVMSEGKQVAEIAYEYIKPAKKRLVVAYAMGENGKANLTKGITADGGTVVWDTEKNTCTYTEGTEAVSAFYFNNDNVTATAIENATVATLEADVIKDKRFLETKTYSIVKIGTQYWMAENLAASYYRDGSSIDYYTSNQMDAWKENTTGAYHIIADDAENISSVYGYMYNGYAVLSSKGLAPEGWEVPTYQQWTSLKNYAGSASTNYRSNLEDSWIDNKIGTNLTGFNVLPGGYFDTTNGDTREGYETFFWSSTSVKDALTRTNAIIPTRVTTGNNIVVSDFSTHDYMFGHYIRCIRK